jgi:hypothetical protein
VQRLFAVFLGLVFVVLAPALSAQGKTDIFIGGSYTFPAVSVVEQPVYCPVEGGTCSSPSATLTDRSGLRGWEVSGERRFTTSWRLRIDASGNYGQGTTGFPRNARAHEYLFLGGPQYTMARKHFSPEFHALFGTVHQSVDASGNSFFVTFPSSQWAFAGAFGGGIDYKVSNEVSLRIVQADYVLTRLSGSFQSAPRVSAGLVIGF